MKPSELSALGKAIERLTSEVSLPHYPSVGSMESLRIQTEKDKQKTITIGKIDPIVRRIAEEFRAIKVAVRVEAAKAILREDGELDDLDDY